MKDFKTHFIYWILPTAFTLLCILLYFFNPAGTASIVSPEFNREFGLLEMTQKALIIVVFILALKAAKRTVNKYEKFLLVFIALASIFILLEEIDYGLHYYELIKGQRHNITVRNIHNNGKITSWFKAAAYVFLALFFVVLPAMSKYTQRRFPLINFLSPSFKIVPALISLILLNQLAFYFYEQNVHQNRSLDGNVSEFEELMIYYIVMLYVREIVQTAKPFPYPMSTRK